MSEKTIYEQLRAAGMSDAGACGMLGNMWAESSLKANIAQRGMTKLTDEEYTEKFDRQPETCYKDGVGYGLCQWTYHTRKEQLRQFAGYWGVSVSAEDMQVAFVVEELKTDHAALWYLLCSTDDLYLATANICMEFERPAVNNIAARYKFAGEAQKRIQSAKLDGVPTTEPDVETCLQGALWDILTALGCDPDINGLAGALRKYAKEVE